MKRNNLSAILFVIAGILWIVTAFMGQDWMFIPIGLCFVVIGVTFREDKSEK